MKYRHLLEKGFGNNFESNFIAIIIYFMRCRNLNFQKILLKELNWEMKSFFSLILKSCLEPIMETGKEISLLQERVTK